jgi:TonB-dependent receptor
MFRYLSAILITLCSISAYAGSIKGTVTDSKNGTPLSGVVVALAGTGKGTVTDFDGKYEIVEVANGSYEITFTYATYITYKQNITVGANESLALDMKLMPESTELKTQVIKSGRITNTEVSVISEIKASSNVVSGTSAAQISKTMDRNAADVVKRIPGVTIQDDKFIVVRGLPDRYNTVWLNDASTPSSEADKKAFSFDIIPAGLIDRVLVFKTPSPELPGDFAGGMVKIYTTSIADKNQFSINLQASSREFSTGSTFYHQNTGKTDWLGYDDGKRNIPSLVPDYITTKDPNYKADISNWSKSFGNDWIVNQKKATPDLRFNLASSNVFKIRNLKIGNTLGVAYANTNTVNTINRMDWDDVDHKSYAFVDTRSTNAVNTGVMDNIGVSWGNNKIEFKNLYNQTGVSQMTLRRDDSDKYTPANTPSQSYLYQYDSKATYSTQLTGTHKNDKDTRKYTWALGYNDLFRNMPDRRIITYNLNTNDPDHLFYSTSLNGTPNILNGGRFYSSLYEHTYSFSQQYTQKVNVKDVNVELNAGSYLEYKQRSFNIREFAYNFRQTVRPDNSYLNNFPVDQIFADSNIDGGVKRFKINEVTHDFDHYDASNRLYAGFVSAKIPIGDLTISGGVRYENNTQALNAIVNLDTIAPSIVTKFLLPSVNLSYNFSEKSLIRAAYGKTVNRPEFREWAPIVYYDFDDLLTVKGSLYPSTANEKGNALKVAEINNFDMRYELYPHAGEMIQLGGFYKTFTDPIQRVLVPGSVSGDSKTVSYINANSGYCYGVEFDVRKNLAKIDELAGTDIFKDLTLVGNVSFVKSQITIDTAKATGGLVGGIPKSSMVGQAPYIINAGLFYQDEKSAIQASLLYNISGPRIYALGTSEPGGQSIGEMPFRSLDFTASKTIKKHIQITAGIQNLLNGHVLFMKDMNYDGKFTSKDGTDRDFRSYYPGRYYSIGVKIKF